MAGEWHEMSKERDTSLSKVSLDVCALIPSWLTTMTYGAAFPVSAMTGAPASDNAALTQHQASFV